jgi:hypothetical protein
MMGRPPIYTAELAERFLERIATGRTLKEVCSDDGMPSEITVRKWVQQDVEGFAARYRFARATGHSIVPGQVRYAREIADAVTEALAAGQTLSAICAEPGMPSTNTISRWVAEDRDGFAGRYRLARQIGHGRTGQIAATSEIVGLILGGLMSGRTLIEICREPDMPHVRTVQQWLADDRDGFAARYRQAREVGYDIVADEMTDIADDRSADWIVRTGRDGDIEAILDPQRTARARLRCDARRGRLSKMTARHHGKRSDPAAAASGGDSWADLLKAVDGLSRGRPNKRRDGEDET